MKPPIYRFADFELDAANRELRRGGAPVQLPAKAFDLLRVLIENNNRLVGKNEIFSRVWQDQIVEESNLTVHVSQIRKALGETKNKPRFITTVPGFGYRFAGEVQNLQGDRAVENNSQSNGAGERETKTEPFATTPNDEPNRKNAVAAPVKSESKTNPDHVRRQSVLVLASAVVLILLLSAAFGFWYFGTKQNASSPAREIPFANAKIKQLTVKGRIGWSAISPDGKFFAYVLSERGEYKQSLWLGQTGGAGGEDVQLRPPSDNQFRGLEFSPDGKTIYFTLEDGENSPGGFFRMPVLGGLPHRLPIPLRSRFAVSPDNRQIAFFRRDAATNDSLLIVADLDNARERELLRRPADKLFSSWKAAWSPDGERIAYAAVTDPVKESSEFFVVDARSGREELLTAREWIGVHTLVWQRDGRGLLAVATSKDRTIRQLWQIEYPGGAAQEVLPDTDSNGAALSISADGKSLLTNQIRRQSNIWLSPAGSLTQARQITFSSMNGVYGWYGLDWMPDDRLVLTAGIDNNDALYSADADGGNIRQITSAGFLDRVPRVLPDGQAIVFQSNRSGGWEIWRVRHDGTDLRQLTTGGGNHSPHPTPDGKWIVYVRSRNGKNSIWKILSEGGESVPITDRNLIAPAVSPDGKFLAGAFRADADAPFQLAVFNFADGSPIRFLDVPRSANFNNGIRFAPDGKALTYRDWSNGVWKQDLTGGEPVRLAGLPAEKIYLYAWSRDGKRFAFTRGTEISDAVLITDSR